ncbi:UDP-3-O-acyl-N-acetylglucosamine deacetylase [cf. Phormidesmis sp. LEGE 11477]|uniref:UDP-3-O-acyl-N-acetylglucosamine deacetylase n=1 Tax=cf. Phormidesmis sp. LEGE 11477 TaxID=1828680 RepID=UPI001880A65A|nr:UDP-3-O-acyl-N-acetylglucosamine deacetylase [cf. Phormidesmis sp. LEGE 11477]MBE9063745.1 UDP-3-O-acyl-N-acetylglucosamine deacetylase [cf. Phormidesmis sp. LEGE 11477]
MPRTDVPTTETQNVKDQELATQNLQETQRSKQQTLSSSVSVNGVGLHLGQPTTVELLPAEPNAGRYFIRTDLAEAVPVAATVGNVVKTQLSTELGISSSTVRTVEHLLSALIALEIDNVRIEIDGPELPLLDGSAKEWVSAIASIPIQIQSAQRQVRSPLSQPISVQSKDAWVAAFPSDELRFSYGIDFGLAAIGNQWHSWNVSTGDFASDIAPARTFGLAHQIDYLRQQGLIKGGTLDNALVCGEAGWLNPPLRFENEPARHKLLDLIGDLSLLGDIPTAHYVAYKASHSLHIKLARQIDERHPL